MLHLLIDTSVWLDLAKRRDGQRWIVPIRVLVHQKLLQILAPRLVIDEFSRNRPRAEDAVSKRVRERFRQLRADLDAYIDDDRRAEWVDEMTYHVPLITEVTLRNFDEVAAILDIGKRLTPSTRDHRRVVERGLDKRAPLHLNKNSVADALLFSMYESTVARSRSKTAHFGFVTANYQDFSATGGDRRTPHEDLATAFASERSHYVFAEEGLWQLLHSHFGDRFLELVDEVDVVQEETRTLGEILRAEQEFYDRVWYVRSIVHDDGADMPSDIREGMLAARTRIEQLYGKDDLFLPIGRGHQKAWDYGYINGKLSALRWVLGSEWDFLDT